jgi:hypothetical protein
MNTIQRKMVPKLHPGRFFMKLRSPFFVQSMYQAVQMKPTLEALKLTNEKEKKITQQNPEASSRRAPLVYTIHNHLKSNLPKHIDNK